MLLSLTMTNNNNTTTAPAEYRTSELRFRNRSNPRYRLDRNRPVKVYRNLSSKCFSIMQDSLVKAHAKTVCLEDIDWKVSQKGRQRVIRDGKKNVHAFSIGLLRDSVRLAKAETVFYNPYLDYHFQVVRNGGARLVRQSAAAVLCADRKLTLTSFEKGGAK